MARMISSQHAKPPPRSLAHHHHPLRGVMTTKGAAPLSVPETTATTLNARACTRSTCTVSRTFEACCAQSAKKAASSLATCSTGGPKGRRKLSALLGQNPRRAPRVTTTIARCRFCRRASPKAPLSAAFGGISVSPIDASLLRFPREPAMPVGLVNPTFPTRRKNRMNSMGAYRRSPLQGGSRDTSSCCCCCDAWVWLWRQIELELFDQ